MAPVNFHVPQPLPSSDPEMRKPIDPDPVLLAEPNVEPAVPAPKMKPVEPVIMARVAQHAPAPQPDADMTDDEAELRAALAMSMEGAEGAMDTEQTNDEAAELAAAIAMSMQDCSPKKDEAPAQPSQSTAEEPPAAASRSSAAGASSSTAPSAADNQQQMMLKVRELHAKYVGEGMDANAAAVRAMKEAQEALK